MRATLAQTERWRKALVRIFGEIETAGGERGPSKLENLVWYAVEEADDEIKRLKESRPDPGRQT